MSSFGRGENRAAISAFCLAGAAVAVLAGCGGVVGGHGIEDPANPGVFAPSSTPFGKTYGEWSALWFQWGLSIPVADNPIADLTGAKAAVGQSGPVFFVCGTSGTPTSAERTITVPAGKGIFFPIVCSWCSIPEDGDTDAVILQHATDPMDHVNALEATLDGRTLVGLWNYRFVSPYFDCTEPPAPDGLYVGYEGTHRTVADGYWIMLEPLPTGPHELYFHGRITYSGQYPYIDAFECAATYHITVQ